jgi:hypothetical protein
MNLSGMPSNICASVRWTNQGEEESIFC